MHLYTIRNCAGGGTRMAILMLLGLFGLVSSEDYNTGEPNPDRRRPATNETKPSTEKLSSHINLMNKVMSRMDARVRPNFDGDAAIIYFGVYVVSIGSISESKMDYSLDMYLRMIWTDDRIQFEKDTSPLVLNYRTIDKIWRPDIYFPNEKNAYVHQVTIPNELMRIYPNGTIIYSVRISLTLSCPMILTHFPLDQQKCVLKMESYGHETSDLLLEWLPVSAVEVSKDLQLPQFGLVGTETTKCYQQYNIGEFPCLQVTFKLRREFGYYLLQTYIPSILIVVLSWVSFWLNVDAVPARISLGVTTVLTMTTQLSGAKVNIPKVSYPKALDVWMSVCMMFVFGALLEYAIVNVLARNVKEKQDKRKKDDDDTAIQFKEEEPVAEPTGIQLLNFPRWLKMDHSPLLVDKLSRMLFPTSFFIFNVVYWVVYTRYPDYL